MVIFHAFETLIYEKELETELSETLSAVVDRMIFGV